MRGSLLSSVPSALSTLPAIPHLVSTIPTLPTPVPEASCRLSYQRGDFGNIWWGIFLSSGVCQSFSGLPLPVGTEPRDGGGGCATVSGLGQVLAAPVPCAHHGQDHVDVRVPAGASARIQPRSHLALHIPYAAAASPTQRQTPRSPLPRRGGWPDR